jgi:hypothetical protein
MALRMQVYVGLLYQDLVKRHELAPPARLPPVLPVVFYNGETAWNASEELRHLIAAGPDELESYQASQRYLLIDQHSIEPAALIGVQNLVAALFRIELSDSPQVLRSVLETLVAWLAGEEQASLRRSIADWICRLQQREMRGETISEVKRLLEGEAMGERYQRKYATWADAIEDAGLQKGLARGREEGREEGKLLGYRVALKRLLAQRFGPVPAAAAMRIDEATEAEVERWVSGMLEAGSIDALLAS